MTKFGRNCSNIILANNATAVAAAAKEAKRLGYSVASGSATHAKGRRKSRPRLGGEGFDDAQRGHELGGSSTAAPRPTCRRPLNDSGGDRLLHQRRRARRETGGIVAPRAGRAKPAVGAGALCCDCATTAPTGSRCLLRRHRRRRRTDRRRRGAVGCRRVGGRPEKNLDPADFLARNDAYHFFEPLAALIKTGPTQTNVCDVRVVIA